MVPFRQRTEFEVRKKEGQKMIDNHPNTVPIIVQSNGLKLDKNKFIVPDEMFAAQFQHFLKKRIDITHHEAIYTFVELPKKESEARVGPTIIASQNQSMGQIYASYRHSDNFLYMFVEKESTFG